MRILLHLTGRNIKFNIISWIANFLESEKVLSEHQQPFFQGYESVLKTLRLDKRDIKNIIEKFIYLFATYETPPGYYEVNEGIFASENVAINIFSEKSNSKTNFFSRFVKKITDTNSGFALHED